ncbi:DUF1269 domain-containing protein [Nocardioides panacihumi]|uniref:DUF1269 domain-containing protein n=1 Tax=Nocardioides panacihumi TaxID=400774 RepID=A0ABP5CUA1_9ACTN
MTTFTVWRFEDPAGAQGAVRILEDAASEGLVRIVDHAVVAWPPGEDRPRIDHAYDDPKRGAAWGALWGVLAGALFAVPVVGGIVGASIGTITKATEGTGITKDDLARIRTDLTPGTSALFLVTDGADLDRLGERFRVDGTTLLRTNLTEAERETLLESFGGT